MMVLATFEGQSLYQGLSKYDDRALVKVAIGLTMNWFLRAKHRRIPVNNVIESVGTIIAETYPHAEYMLSDNMVYDHRTGKSIPLTYPKVHAEPDKNYRFGEYSTTHSGLYCRFAEVVELLVQSYTRPVMGFLQHLEEDKYATNIQLMDYTDRYIAVVINCRNLIEYEHNTPATDALR